MSRIIGVQVASLTEEREKRLRSAAEELGFSIKLLPKGSGYEPQELSDCEILFGGFPASELRHATSLKWFATSNAGINNYVSDDIYPHEGVILTNSSGAYGVAISEHLLVTALMLLRRMPEYAEQQREKKWNYLGKVRSIYGSVVTVVGTGDIGGNFARRCKALGAYVRGVKRSRTEKPDYIDELYLRDELIAAIRDADVVALCLPGTAETEHIIGERELGSMKPGAILLNVGRGSAIDQQALMKALESGRLGGAALDVTETEPLPASDPLWDMPNLIITPHVSGNDSLSHTTDMIVDMFIEDLKLYVEGRPMLRVMDRKKGY